MSKSSKRKKTQRQDYIGFCIDLGALALHGAIARSAIAVAPFSSALAAPLPLPLDDPLLANNLFANNYAQKELAVNKSNIIPGDFPIALEDIEGSAYEFGTGNMVPRPKDESDRKANTAKTLASAISPIFFNSKGFGQTPNALAPHSLALHSEGATEYELFGLREQSQNEPPVGQTVTQKAQLIFNFKFFAKATKILLYSDYNIYQLAANMQPIDYSNLSSSVSNTDGDNVGAENSNNNNTGETNTVGSNTGDGNNVIGNIVGSNTGDGNRGGSNPGGGSGRKKVSEPSTLAYTLLADLSLCCKRRGRRA